MDTESLEKVGKLSKIQVDLESLDKVLERKMLYNTKYIELLDRIMENTIENYHRILKNLDDR